MVNGLQEFQGYGLFLATVRCKFQGERLVRQLEVCPFTTQNVPDLLDI